MARMIGGEALVTSLLREGVRVVCCAGGGVRNPDFMKLADAFGVVGLRAREPLEAGDLVDQAIEMDRPVLVEVPVGRMSRPRYFMPLRRLPRYQRPGAGAPGDR
ncbi:MAG: hypothetical protein HYY95_02705 [Candidatus Rokubacteria bacterium]|nr:hypothetical protein [Candidatus Rokubacteria bacterium]MBI3104486.1 hypothetical protein [Candidatus Rokubacteria bacterium]